MKTMMIASMILAGGMAFAEAPVENKEACPEGGNPPPKVEKGERRGPRDRGMRGPEGHGPMAGRMGVRENNGNWMARFLSKPENLDKLGIKDEEVKTKLNNALKENSEKSRELGKKIQEGSIEQAKIAKEVMEKPGADATPLRAKIEEIGKLRTEQALLATDLMLKIRDTLTPEQRENVRKLMMEEGKERFNRRREFNQQMENRKPDFKGGKPEGRGKNKPAMRGKHGKPAIAE